MRDHFYVPKRTHLPENVTYHSTCTCMCENIGHIIAWYIYYTYGVNKIKIKEKEIKRKKSTIYGIANNLLTMRNQ